MVDENVLPVATVGIKEGRTWRSFGYPVVQSVLQKYNRDRGLQDVKRSLQESKEFTPEEILELYDQQYRLQKQADGVMRKHLLTEKEKMQLNRLVKGEIGLEDLPQGVN